MSGALLGVGAQLVSILFRPKRAIGNIYPNVVMSEEMDDNLAITMHPVEKTADITDHAYMQPVQATIHARWSDSSIQAVASMFTGGDILGIVSDGAFGSVSYSAQQYKKILALQASRIPFDVVTGKRKISSCLMARVHNVTDRHTEYSLALDITVRQIILVSTSSTTLPPSTAQSAPQQTASPTPSGTLQSALASPQSLALQGANSLGVTGAIQGAQTSVSNGLSTITQGIFGK